LSDFPSLLLSLLIAILPIVNVHEFQISLSSTLYLDFVYII